MRFTFSIRTLLIVCVFSGIYLYAYRGLLEPDNYISESAGGIAVGHREPNFCYGGRFSRLVFLPATSIDQLIRPSYWNDLSTPDRLRRTDVESVDYPWGDVTLINGRATSIYLYAHSEEDVQAAVLVLQDAQALSRFRVNGSEFNDQHLRSLYGLRNLVWLELLATSVTREAVDEFRREHPHVDLLCFATTQDGSQLY